MPCFFGCSMTFGEGVQSNETTSFYFGNENKKYMPYNLAFSGYGPSQMFARLHSNQLEPIVKQKSGLAFFVYIPDHINRANNTMTYFGYNGGNVPNIVKKNKKYELNGIFNRKNRLKTILFSFFLKSNILKFFQVGYPFKMNENHVQYTVDIIESSKQIYQQQFPNSEFYTIIYPTKSNQTEFIKRLKKVGIKVLDYSLLFDPFDSKYAIPFDEHPTHLANQIIAQKIKKDLKL